MAPQNAAKRLQEDASNDDLGGGVLHAAVVGRAIAGDRSCVHVDQRLARRGELVRGARLCVVEG
eukprot:CAMPEP_0171182222 /NCGR_PEP_ID=MMETSP0790-20130122/14657_1 /TAXON_ID=2925 /ORGANISM="Alexandrium catenella, Strain OF101" /LENGTH=63 /DNA_ID=CAMNT_0011647171 /DNA_START=82 /DNA_END=270 /DNA_ORIENTATION=-